MNLCDLAVESIAGLQPYVPGKPIEELQRQYGVRDVIKLASNESPIGPSQAAQAAIALATRDLTRYPDGNGYALKLALSEKFQVDANQITLGNGSNDVLELIARCFASPADEVIFSQHAFAVYPLVTQAIGATLVEVPAKQYGHDLTTMQQAVTEKTKLIFIANPNNPTGTHIPATEVHSFLQSVADNVIVVLDEAYVEYGDEDVNSIDWLRQFPNLIICRTFSKAYGLAGLRVGFALSSPEIADLLNRLRQPFNVNHLAMSAAIAALGDEDYLQRAKQVNNEGMQQYIDGFDAMGLNYIPSKANFICVDVNTDAADIYEKLLQQGVIVRPVAGYGLPNHLRISIGLEHENQRCLEALANSFSEAK
ncbi:MAG: histidinol-phosphate transaminase [Methylophaga sp.]|jgi:histidinol-phosphate aminotransferase|uniref:histidinol-phosphate transaminase n=1 Tax=Methylophaga sp. TaxID=2024840 RepID=UPI000C0CD6B2|nr:histidinol-phosphate transaminase [Methylophaga sp.]MBL1457761.1 histidinol-phosphate transaminase [Methylophaga sp.]